MGDWEASWGKDTERKGERFCLEERARVGAEGGEGVTVWVERG